MSNSQELIGRVIGVSLGHSDDDGPECPECVRSPFPPAPSGQAYVLLLMPAKDAALLPRMREVHVR